MKRIIFLSAITTSITILCKNTDHSDIISRINYAFYKQDRTDSQRVDTEDAIVNLVQQGGAKNINFNQIFQGKTLLMEAVTRGNEKVVKALLDNGGVDVNSVSTYVFFTDRETDKYTEITEAGKTALIYASQIGNANIIKMLLQHGANINFQDGLGRTALMEASNRGYENIVKSLLEHNANVNTGDKNGWTALMYAAQAGNENIAAMLLQHSANINAQENDGSTALMLAAKNKRKNIIKLLLSNLKTDIYIKNKNGQNLNDIIIASKDPDMANILKAFVVLKKMKNK